MLQLKLIRASKGSLAGAEGKGGWYKIIFLSSANGVEGGVYSKGLVRLSDRSSVRPTVTLFGFRVFSDKALKLSVSNLVDTSITVLPRPD